MSQTVLKAIFNTKGRVLGEVFETETNNFGFYHADTEITRIGYADFNEAIEAWHCFHDDYFENLPR